jgi:ankyrin repeat protein
MFSNLFSGKKKNPYQVPEVYTGLRQQVLNLSQKKPEEIPALISSDRIAIIMETGLKDYCFSLVAISDGTASMYFSNGGGIIGAGVNPGCARIAKSFLDYSKEFDNQLKKVSEYPLPQSGMTRFYVIKSGIILSQEFKDEELGNNKLAISPLYQKGHELITAIRKLDERKQMEPPIINAIWDDSGDIVNKLLKDGINPNTLNSQGTPALAIAVSRKQIDIIKALISSGANPNIKFSNENREYKDAPLVNFAVAFGDTNILKMLKDAGMDLESSDSTGLTPLMAAAHLGNVDVLNYLLAAGCHLELKDQFGYTALMFASNSGKLNCAEALINKGADVNAIDKDKSTPIMFAAQYGFNDIVKLLLDKGANPDAKGIHGFTALKFAEQNHREETVRILNKALNIT